MGFCVYNRLNKQYVEMNVETCRYAITTDYTKTHHFKKRKCAVNFLDNDTQKILTQSGWEVISDAILKELLESEKKEESQTKDDKANKAKPTEKSEVLLDKELDKDIPDTVKPFIKASQKIDISLEDMEKLKNFQHYEADAKLSESFEVPNIDIVDTIRKFEKFLKKMKSYADVLSKQYTYIENCKLDFEHKMEFDGKKMSYTKRSELLTNYSTCLEERRRIKDDILVLEKLLNSSVEDLINGEMDEFLHKLENRQYHPRVAPELFEQQESVQVKPKFKLDSLSHDSMAQDADALNKSLDIVSENMFSGGSLLGLLSGFTPIQDCGD